MVHETPPGMDGYSQDMVDRSIHEKILPGRLTRSAFGVQRRLRGDPIFVTVLF